ncbi:MAG: tyrosine-type recombinase/integrase [Candidatus Nanoarchaeia archaeon]|nr:tyrosine-type recombinase/integrase [Candidatus Nanoarchaeia archaeon]
MVKSRSKGKKRIRKGRDKQPIRDLEMIRVIKEYLFEKSLRDWFLFVLGINTGRRIGDLLPLKVKDIKNKEHLFIFEKKTEKTIKIRITKIQKEINLYINNMDNEDFLFPSRQINKYQEKSHITYKRAYQILRNTFEKFGLNNTATHTMRKTFGYWYYKLTGDIEGLRQIFNHGSTQTTLIYIGVTQQEIDINMDKVKL